MERAKMKRNERRGILCFLLFLSLMALDVFPGLKGPGTAGRVWAVDPSMDTAALQDTARAGGDVDSPTPGPEGLWKTAGVFLLGAGLSLFLLIAWRRQRGAPGAGANARNSMQVLSRVVLSPRHTACLLKVGPAKLVVVALCGETMTPLCTIDGEEEISKFLEEDGESGLQDLAAGNIEIAGNPLGDSPGGLQSFFAVLRRSLFPAPTGVER